MKKWPPVMNRVSAPPVVSAAQPSSSPRSTCGSSVPPSATIGARTVSDVFELQSTFARSQLDAYASQFKEFQAMAEKLVTATTKPVSSKVEKTFKEFKAA